MRVRTFPHPASLCIILLLAGCADLVDRPPEFTNPNTPIQVLSGSTFAIRLESNPTTGYEWAVAGSIDATYVTLLHTSFGPGQGPSTQPGAPGVQTFTLQANRPGKTTITFDYRRPWEKDQAPTRAQTFTIIVKS